MTRAVLKPFEVSEDEVGRLAPIELVQLVKRLIQADLQSWGAPLSAVQGTLRINISDGGEDILLAFKHIGLSEKLNGTEKQVAAFLIDSFNRRTGRCDPSVATQAFYSVKSRRTVLRAIDRLVKLKFFHKIRHGGHSHCNSYEPNWEVFRSLELAYRERRRERSQRFDQKLASSERQSCHSGGVNFGTQTSLKNNIPLTYASFPSNPQPKPFERDRLSNEITGPSATSRLFNSSASREVSRMAAERRWNSDLLNRFRKGPWYAAILGALDSDLQSTATDAELKRAGAGSERIIRELVQRRVLPADGL